MLNTTPGYNALRWSRPWTLNDPRRRANAGALARGLFNMALTLTENGIISNLQSPISYMLTRTGRRMKISARLPVLTARADLGQMPGI
jgi:hypothetical protein